MLICVKEILFPLLTLYIQQLPLPLAVAPEIGIDVVSPPPKVEVLVKFLYKVEERYPVAIYDEPPFDETCKITLVALLIREKTNR